MEVLIVQPDIYWENPQANLDKLENILISSNLKKPDLVVLPEMFTSGFTMNSASLAESLDGLTISWMKDMAASENFAMAGSLIVKEGDRYYNKLVFAGPDGILATYNKGHLFRMEKENLSFTRGEGPVITEYKGFKISLQICYDLRFPVWSRNTDNNYDILLYVANWPESRRHVWNSLLVARAIENQCYVIGANRIGRDENGISYSGDSVVIDPKGKISAGLEPYKEGTVGTSLSLESLRTFRDKFPVWKDADSFKLL